MTSSTPSPREGIDLKEIAKICWDLHFRERGTAEHTSAMNKAAYWLAPLHDELLAMRQSRPQWHVFDKDDSSTWPEQKNQACWLHHSRPYQGEVRFGMWWSTYDADAWQRDSVTHWMPLVVPEAPPAATTPSSEREGDQ